MIALRKLVNTFTLALVLGAAFGAAQAPAAFSIETFDGEWTALDGSSLTQAGAHAEVHFDIQFPSVANSRGETVPDGTVRTVKVDLPPGLVGNPTTVGTCPEAKLVFNPVLGNLFSSCPPDSTVGLAEVRLVQGGLIAVPVSNLQPAPGTAAQFGFNLFGGIVRISAFTGEGGRTISTLTQVSQAAQVVGTELTLWGVPTADAHNAERGIICEGEFGVPDCPANLPPAPFMALPTDCAAGPLNTQAAADSWEQPGLFSSASSISHLPDGTPTGVSGCENLDFKPTMTVSPTTREALAPTGLEVELTVPQDQNPESLATPHVKKVVTQLPPGLTVNASQANGLAACSPQQIGLGTNSAVTCPEASTVGTVEIETPLLEERIEGSVYLAQQGTNPFNSLLALYIVAANPERGVLVKLAGKVAPDARTGQLIATFDETPQLPFETLRLRLNGGDRAALVTPSCGTYGTQAELTSWAQAEAVESDSSFTIDQGCGRGAQFTPGFTAGTSNPVAGKSSSFSLRVTRPDGQENVARVESVLPEGLLAKLAGVPLCADAEAAAGACPEASRVGAAAVGAGVGGSPVFVPQPGKSVPGVYLAGPYKGGPYSLVAQVPAQAGPFDLGTVSVRTRIEIDPVTARVSVSSDPLPQILQGIPISYRDIRVDVNRGGFTLNPTSCTPMAVQGTIGSVGGKAVSVDSRFQVAGCERLGFKPKLALRLSGKTNRSAHPKLQATLTMPQGGANIARAAVTLPKTEFLEQSHIKTICTRVQYAAKACPKASIYGYAKAWSPLLDKPLEGPVYLRSSSNPLPDLVASLDGQIHIDLSGRIDTKNARIRNTFDLVPDAPVSKFVLTMQGGKKGLLVNNTELCKAKPRADVRFDGQNGKTADSQPLVKVDCGKKGKGEKK